MLIRSAAQPVTFYCAASRSPYADKRTLAVPGTAEVRQYMAICVLKDEEIGLMSDIIEVVFGG